MHKRKLTWLLLILLVLSSVCLACSAGKQEIQEVVPAPIRPVLDVQVQEDGGICLDRHDTLELLLYLQELERRL